MSITSFLKAMILAYTVNAAFGQDVSKRFHPPACNLYRIEDTPVLSLKQRFCLWEDRSLFNSETFFGAALGGAYSQLTERASDRQKGFLGYWERTGTKYAQST